MTPPASTDEPDDSATLPSIEILEQMRRLLSTCGLDEDEAQEVDPIILTLMARLHQSRDTLHTTIAELVEANTQLKKDNARLREQRDALRVAVAGIRLAASENLSKIKSDTYVRRRMPKGAQEKTSDSD